MNRFLKLSLTALGSAALLLVTYFVIGGRDGVVPLTVPFPEQPVAQTTFDAGSSGEILFASANPEPPLQVAIAYIGKPYAYLDPAGNADGISLKLAGQVFNRASIKAEYQATPYTRSITLMNRGDIDAMAITTSSSRPTELPDNVLIIPAPITRFPIIMYKRQDRQITINTAADLANYRLGLVRVDRYPGMDESNVTYYPRSAALYIALVDGEIDIALTLPYFVEQWSGQLKTEITQIAVVDYINIYMAFSVKKLGGKTAEICKAIAIAVKQSQEDGSIEKTLREENLADLIPYYVINTETTASNISTTDCVSSLTPY